MTIAPRWRAERTAERLTFAFRFVRFLDIAARTEQGFWPGAFRARLAAPFEQGMGTDSLIPIPSLWGQTPPARCTLQVGRPTRVAICRLPDKADSREIPPSIDDANHDLTAICGARGKTVSELAAFDRAAAVYTCSSGSWAFQLRKLL
jgi:hypothetical protein